MASSLFILGAVSDRSSLSSLFEVTFVETLASFAATYWLHSTLLLGAAWLLLRSAKPDSHFVRERIWKLAATAGLATAAVQLVTGLGVSLIVEPDSAPSVTRSVSEGLVSETAKSELSPAEASQHLTTSLKLVQESLSHLGKGLPETLAEPKLPREEVAATSTPAATGTALIRKPTVTFLPLDDEAATIAGTASSNVNFIATADAGSAVSAGEALAVFEQRAAASTGSWHRTLACWTALGWFSLSLLYLAWQSLQFRWQMRHVSEAAPSHRKLLDSICESHGLKRRVRLLKSDRFEEPVAYGLFRQTILIPSQVERRLNRDELAALLSHELAHLTRGDIVWLVIGRVLTTCFAFQPLNFLARRRWQEHAEFQCDDWAVDRNVDRLTLARSLTLVAEWQARRRSCAGVVSAGGGRFHISDRVERLVAEAVPDLWRGGSRRLAVHFAALFTAAAVIAFGPQTGSAERGAEETKSKTATVETESGNDADSQPAFDEGLSIDETAAISTEEISALIREVEGLSGDVSELLAELRTIEPLLAKLEQRPELADQVSQLRTRIGLLRELAELHGRKTGRVSQITESKN